MCVCGSVWWVQCVQVHYTRVIRRLIRKRRLQAADGEWWNGEDKE